MAWNEPGGNGNDNDPWGNRKNSGGPPDLDEFFKNLSDKLNGLFGGGKKRSGGGGKFPSGPKLSLASQSAQNEMASSIPLQSFFSMVGTLKPSVPRVSIE